MLFIKKVPERARSQKFELMKASEEVVATRKKNNNARVLYWGLLLHDRERERERKKEREKDIERESERHEIERVVISPSRTDKVK